EKAISKEGFKNKVYTQKELENIEKRGDRVETYAGIFSAKEAISKAIGTGVREFSLTDLEILNDDLGKPYVAVSEKLDKIIKDKNKIKEFKNRLINNISKNDMKKDKYTIFMDIIKKILTNL
ncbi:4'-phosphopantetheinyl transferase superfamily protein, partial [uncultured Campylobacter sp.]|uniref:holo-ACP synthase n=1 Tax=uncultured Campylobacter sp. TaxID=218934 RepID=UPI00262C6D71